MLAFIDGQAIAEWAARIGASHQLPRLIRRLIWATLSPLEIKHINFPAGADVQLPGFDGQLETSVQSQWIPQGRSVWELSVQGQSSTKARKDYIKRCSTCLCCGQRPTLERSNEARLDRQ